MFHDETLFQGGLETRFLARGRIADRRKNRAIEGRLAYFAVDDDPLGVPHDLQATIMILCFGGILGNEQVQGDRMTSAGKKGQDGVVGVEEDPIAGGQGLQPVEKFGGSVITHDFDRPGGRFDRADIGDADGGGEEEAERHQADQ